MDREGRKAIAGVDDPKRGGDRLAIAKDPQFQGRVQRAGVGGEAKPFIGLLDDPVEPVETRFTKEWTPLSCVVTLKIAIKATKRRTKGTCQERQEIPSCTPSRGQKDPSDARRQRSCSIACRSGTSRVPCSSTERNGTSHPKLPRWREHLVPVKVKSDVLVPHGPILSSLHVLSSPEPVLAKFQSPPAVETASTREETVNRRKAFRDRATIGLWPVMLL